MTELQPPGAGLPPIENFAAKVFFRLKCAMTSDEKALRQFELESDTILNIADQADLNTIDEPILIGRLTGIEDSSRHWSVLMVLDHLIQTNRDMLNAIDALKRGIVPRGEIDVALYKPDPNVGTDVIDDFRNSVYDYLEVVRAHVRNKGLRTPLTFAHPWFGELNAHAWNCLAAVHTKIHRRQAYAIVARLGIT